MKICSFDTETALIGYKQLFPKMVCLQLGFDDGSEPIIVPANDPLVLDYITEILTNEDYQLIGVNVAFDLGVFATNYPSTMPLIWTALAAGRVHCCRVREKLLALASGGDTTFYKSQDKLLGPVSGSMAAMLLRYSGKDILSEKNSEQGWRTNYIELLHKPLIEWPKAAVQYAKDDITHALTIYQAQEDAAASIKRNTNIDALSTQSFRCSIAFSLKLMTSWGNKVDAEYLTKAFNKVKEATDLNNFPLMVENKIVSPEVAAKPYANKLKAHSETCQDKKNCTCPLKVKKAKAEKLNKKNLLAYIKQVPDVTLWWHDEKDNITEDQSHAKTLKNGKPSDIVANAAWFEEFGHLDPLLKEYKARQKEIKLLTSYLPKFYLDPMSGTPYDKKKHGTDPRKLCVPSPIIRSDFDVLKKTGRTSSYGGSLYPSQNGQQVDPRIRGVIVPRDGYYLFSIDYSGMELGTLAQTCINLFGYSVLGQKLNAGINAHSYLGSQIAWNLNRDFQEDTKTTDTDAIYEKFMLLEGNDDPCTYTAFTNWYKTHRSVTEVTKGDFFKHFRTFAKPTGLGFPGGLGVKTFCLYAKAIYGIDLDLQTAKKLKQIWLDTYPEMNDYFKHITTNCVDSYQSSEDNTKYQYTTPFGMVRPNCNFTAACNGLGLQSPSAEGALLGLVTVVHQAYNQGYVLSDDAKGVRFRPTLFIHDEIFGEVRKDVADECVTATIGLMKQSMETITPQVTASAEPALMSERWNKAAFEFRVDGQLRPWEDSDQYKKYLERKK